VNTAKEEEKRGLFVLFDPPVRAIPQLAIVDNIVIIFFLLFPFLLFPLFFNHMEVSLESLDDSERVEASAASDYLRRRISRCEQQRVGREFGQIAGLESAPPPTSRPKTSMQAAGLITL
jgi:hypothetical protein